MSKIDIIYTPISVGFANGHAEYALILRQLPRGQNFFNSLCRDEKIKLKPTLNIYIT